MNRCQLRTLPSRIWPTSIRSLWMEGSMIRIIIRFPALLSRAAGVGRKSSGRHGRQRKREGRSVCFIREV